MSNIKRYYEKGVSYFITTVTNERRDIFKDPLACELFLAILTYNKYQYDFKLYGFVIMPDHIHLIIQPNGEKLISEIMRNIKGTFSRFYNKQNKGVGSLWQGGFYDRGIRNDFALMETMAYIHGNPIKHQMNMDINQYPYSSHSFYMGNNSRYQVLLDSIKI